jgi:hypothetical protein
VPAPKAPAPLAPPPSDKEPERPGIAEELRVLTAKRVSIAPRKKAKPKTAKEALRARTEEKRAKAPPPKTAKERRPVGDDEREDDERETSAEDEANERESAPAPRAGLWQKIKGVFRK